MRSRFHAVAHCLGAGVLAVSAAYGAAATPAAAEDFRLAPFTKLRVEVNQWDPAKGDFQHWDALSRDVAVAGDGTVDLPAIGTVDAATLDAGQFAAIVSKRLKDRVGLLELPETTVSILEYPPIYVVGDVTTPGEYKFRPGMSVLQALAVAGGFYRNAQADGAKEMIALKGRASELGDEILRADGRIARLRAERDDAATIDFPPTLENGAAGSLPAEIVAQESAIRTARRTAIERQAATLSELRELLKSEIRILGEKAASLDDQIAAAEREFDGVKSLYDKGVATVGRRSEIERAVMSLRSNRLDQMAATMRARQALSSAERDAAALLDTHRTEVVLELQQAEASREKLLIQEATGEKQIGYAVANGAEDAGGRERVVEFAIVRKTASSAEDVAASEDTAIAAGDTLKVTVRDGRAGAEAGILTERFAASNP